MPMCAGRARSWRRHLPELALRLAGPADRARWNAFVAASPGRHFMQAYEWGEVKAPYGWRPLRLLCEGDGHIRAVAGLLKRPVGPFSMCYVPKGPVFEAGAGPALQVQVLAALVRLARQQRAIYLKVDPDIPAADVARLAPFGEQAFRPSSGQIQMPATMLLDVTGTEEELLARMKPKWRYNIRLAEKRGVEIVPGTQADFPEAYRIYQETGARDGFLVRPYNYCALQWGTYLEAGMAGLWFARYDGQALAVILPVALGTRMWYLFGGSRSLHRNLMPAHLLQWQAMRWGREQGCTEYDMWGAPEVLAEGQPLWGVYLFKQGFGAEYVRWAGAYDRVLRPALHTAWVRGVPAYLRLLRRLRGQKVNELQLSGV